MNKKKLKADAFIEELFAELFIYYGFRTYDDPEVPDEEIYTENENVIGILNPMEEALLMLSESYYEKSVTLAAKITGKKVKDFYGAKHVDGIYKLLSNTMLTKRQSKKLNELKKLSNTYQEIMWLDLENRMPVTKGLSMDIMPAYKIVEVK